MNRRLPPCEGEWIDRDRPIQFRFEGQTYQGFAGDILCSALWANDVRMMGRSFKYHRPRSLYSLAGHDANVIVENGEQTNLRGDMLPITEGLEVRSVNTFGGLRRDRMRFMEKFGRFLPVGFYYKAFHTPRWLFPFYENQMRKAAGLGRINPTAKFTSTPKDYAFCDLLVVGAGPAGLSGAIAAAQQGLRVLLVDENPHPGGSLTWQHAGDSAAREQLQQLLEQAAALENLEVRLSTRAGGYYADQWIVLTDAKRLTKLRARATLIATGCIEQPAVFQNNDLPGVMLASAAQRLIRQYAIKPFERVAVLAANRDGYRAALDLHGVGIHVELIDPRPNGETTDLAQLVAEAGIVIHRSQVIEHAIPASGKTTVEGAVLRAFEENGIRKSGASSRIDCDGIVLSTGWAPNAALLYQASVKFGYAEQVEQLIPCDFPPGLFAAGRVNGLFDLNDRLADGNRAGLAAAAYLGAFDGEVPACMTHQGEPPSHPYPVFSEQGSKAFVEFDEDLQFHDIVNAHQEGYDNIELLKRYTTAGMGPSQGKLANMNAVRILARLNDKSIDETGTTTSRPFFQPVPLGHLAGRRFHPQRRTPMHDWHVKSQAKMMHAGAWLRPEYYEKNAGSRDECILSEATNVRENVGLIDVSTLGKIFIHGPDAASFLERIYTGRFAKQPVGKLRYGLACDETGVIIEDGVVARTAEQTYYVTATSSGAAAFYRELQRWAMIWQMDVELVNSTGQLAAMNLAGPRSRELLEKLTDVDLSTEAFPYLGVRQGKVAAAPATMLRVGFVGELGYEIHVPASHGLHVWKSLMQAGESVGIQPFGVEAQRLLRLEKGHLIVGLDTDALTNPYEAEVAWSIGQEKPFFVGGRSLHIAKQQPLRRKLVGIAIAKTHRGPLPEECHLIIHDGEIVGRITSIAHRSTLGYAVALAFLQPDLCEIGSRVRVRIGDGKFVSAEVVRLPFYDPDNIRQK